MGREGGRMSRVFHPVKTKFRHASEGAALAFLPSFGRLPCPPEPPAKLDRPPRRPPAGPRPRARRQVDLAPRPDVRRAGAGRDHRSRGLLEGEDVLRTAAALRALGAEVVHERTDEAHVAGPRLGVGGGREPGDVLDLGNSGTRPGCCSGILASHPFTSFMTGDASLRRRPMERVIEPLSRMGARFAAREGGRLPLAIIGTDELVPIDYRLPVPSAQVKSAILLAGLNTPGETTVIEPEATRDHTERMLRHFGAEVRVDAGRRAAASASPSSAGPSSRRATSSCRAIPRRPPSPSWRRRSCRAATSRSRMSGSIRCAPASSRRLREMGADIAFENEREAAASRSPICASRAAALKGVDVPAERAPSMIDEYPDPRRRRRLRRGHDAHAGPGRAARQGKRPAGRASRPASPPTA